MELEVPIKRVRVKCGCGRIFSTMRAYWGHTAYRKTPQCTDDPTNLMDLDREQLREQLSRGPEEIREGGLVASPPPGPGATDAPTESSSESSSQGTSEEADGNSPAKGEGAAVVDPALPKAAKPTEEFGALRPSMAPERGVSFPVLVRFAYDAWRVNFPGYNKPFGQWLFDMLELARWAAGLHPAAIWTEPGADPPPDAIRGEYSEEGLAEVMEEVQGAPAAAG